MADDQDKRVALAEIKQLREDVQSVRDRFKSDLASISERCEAVIRNAVRFYDAGYDDAAKGDVHHDLPSPRDPQD